MTIRFVGVAIGVRNAAAAATAVLMSTGRGEMPMAVAAATPIGMTISAVAVLLMSCPMMAVSTNSPASSATGPASPTKLTRCFGHQLCRARLHHRSGKRHHRADEDHRRPVDRAIGLLDAHDPRQDDRTGSKQSGYRRRHDAGGEKQDHRDQDDDGLAGARPHGHGLTTHQLGRIDDKNVWIVEVDVEGLPGSLKQHRVTRLQHDTAGVRCALTAAVSGAGALHRQNDQVAAFGDHARKNASAR